MYFCCRIGYALLSLFQMFLEVFSKRFK